MSCAGEYFDSLAEFRSSSAILALGSKPLTYDALYELGKEIAGNLKDI